jgi:hypothetical protein
MVLSSRACPPQAELWCVADLATTECEFDLAATQIAEPARTADHNQELHAR